MEGYYENPALSHSRLKEIRKSPGHFRWALENPSPSTDAMNLGSLVHAMVLEPHTVESCFVKAPKIDRRTKAGKEEYALFQSQAMDKMCVPASDWDTSVLMAESVKSHPVASKVLDDAVAYGMVEKEYYWEDRVGGYSFDRKAKVDGLCRDAHYGMNSPLVDLKTTTDASPFAFKRSVTKYSYGTQMAYYRDAVRSGGVDPCGAIIIAVDKKAPFTTAVYRLSYEALDRAKMVVDKWLATYAECSESGTWPSFWELNEVDVPDWFLSENGVDI